MKLQVTDFNPQAWAVLITAVASGVAALMVAIGTLINGMRSTRLAERANAAAKQSADKTGTKLDALKGVADKVHELANGAQLRLKKAEAAALREFANSLLDKAELHREIFRLRGETAGGRFAIEAAEHAYQVADARATHAEEALDPPQPN